MEPPAVALFRQAYNLISVGITDAVAEVAPLQRPSLGNVMEQLDYRDGLRLTDIARGAGMAPQSIGELVDELERLGMVERRPDPDDRRAKRIHLTEKARTGQRAAFKAARASDERIAAVIGTERLTELKADMSRIIAAFESNDAGAGTEGTSTGAGTGIGTGA